jgi:hypothetical protein
MTRYGFYSAKAAVRFGYSTYTTPSGNKVDVTEVSQDPDGSNYNWADKVKVGVVIDYVRSIPSDIEALQKYENRE